MYVVSPRGRPALGTCVRVRALLCELTGAEDALAVNNGAGAALLAVAATGAGGGAVAVSRGQLVETGGSFRVPDVIAQAGVRMIEVGASKGLTCSEAFRHMILVPDPEPEPE